MAVGDQEFLFVILKILLNIMKLPPLNRVELVIEDGRDIIVDGGPSVRCLRVNHVIVIMNKGIYLFLGLGIRRIGRLFVALRVVSLRDIVLAGCGLLCAEHLFRSVYSHDYILIISPKLDPIGVLGFWGDRKSVVRERV